MFEFRGGREANPTSRRLVTRSLAFGSRRLILATLIALAVPAAATGGTGGHTPAGTASAISDLTQIGLEDLMNLTVTSASRHEQRLSDIAAAVTIIGRDQIRSCGATTLAEVLRLVPGLQVAHIDANMWSISARGFSGRIANKLLLLVDGRSVYSPVFSGVYWDEQDLLLEDIERIEVIRGPGASVWGANAVNGVINVITRDAHDTPGTMFSATSGTEELGGGSARWAGPLGTDGAVRVYTRGAARAAGAILGRDSAWDSWQALFAGFRADLPTSSRSHWTIMGEARRGNLGQSLFKAEYSAPYMDQLEFRTKSSGGNLLADWRRELSPHSDLTIQGYLDVTRRDDDVLHSHLETFDLDLKHHVAAGRHDFVWGLGARMIRDRLDSTSVAHFTPDHEMSGLLSGFAQDEVALADHHVRLTFGARLEDTHSTRTEFQPTVRALWSPSPSHSLWAAASRAVRTPSLAEARIRYHVSTAPTAGPPAVVTIYGSEGFRSEVLVAYELGYRFSASQTVLCDVAGFYNDYDRLRSIEPGVMLFDPSPTPHLDVQQRWANRMFGDTRGLEASATWNPNAAWRLVAGASCLAMRLHLEPGSQDVLSVNTQFNEPGYQLMLQSQLHPLERWRWDATVYQIGRRKSQGVPAYTRLDLGLAWHGLPRTELSLLGANLLQARHLEDDGVFSGVIPTQVERSVTARITVGLRTE